MFEVGLYKLVDNPETLTKYSFYEKLKTNKIEYVCKNNKWFLVVNNKKYKDVFLDCPEFSSYEDEIYFEDDKEFVKSTNYYFIVKEKNV